jgi:hypothetical protein
MVLVACECYGKVRDAFIDQGIEAISCDLKSDRSTHPKGEHYQGDMFDGTLDLASFDLIIAHPPCTAIATSGNATYRNTPARSEGAEFFKKIWDIPISKLAIENPITIINGFYYSLPKPYYIQPWHHGHPAQKMTGIWSRGLPKLVPTWVVTPHPANSVNNASGKGEELRELRSITYSGIAKAMASQWKEVL